MNKWTLVKELDGFKVGQRVKVNKQADCFSKLAGKMCTITMIGCKEDGNHWAKVQLPKKAWICGTVLLSELTPEK